MPTPDPVLEAKLAALHRYFIWANRMRDHLRDMIEERGIIPEKSAYPSVMTDHDKDLHARSWFLPFFCYYSMWLGMLYVVVEGWQTLKLKDEAVETLLTPEFLEKLRRYRNGAFHFQPEYLDERFQAFLMLNGNPEHFETATRLHSAISDWFLKRFAEEGRKLPDLTHWPEEFRRGIVPPGMEGPLGS